jgi:PREDICTED: hypothetical protein, partial|nr:MAG TPA: hypothetical protein [Herelleviridae sp.]
MEISVKNTGTGIVAFQHLGTVISLGPGESFKSNLDFTVPEKQVIASQPELVYSNSEEQPVKGEEVKTKPEPKKAQPEVTPEEEEGDDLPEEEEVEEVEEEEQATAEEESKEDPKSKKKGNKK